MSSFIGGLTEKFNALSPARKHVLVAGALLLFLLAAYCNSFNADFHYDDIHQVVKNANIRDIGNIPGFFKSGRLGTYLMGSKGYRPVVYSSFAVNYAVSGERVWSYHLFNFIVHFADALLVFVLAFMVLKRAGKEGAFLLSLFVSLAFALHPLQTGAVTYISGRAVPMAVFFFLLALTCFLRFRMGIGGKVGIYACAAAVPVLYFLGLLTKEMVVSLPAVMLVYDLLFTVPARDASVRGAKLWLYYLPFIAGLIIYLVIRKNVAGYFAVPDNPYGWLEYFLSEARVLLMYLRLLVLPVNQNLDYNLLPSGSLGVSQFVSLLLVALAAIFLYRLRRRDPAVTFFGTWFFITLAPESSIIPISDLAVEYRLYLPSVGFIAALAILMTGRLRPPAIWKLFAALLLAIFTVLTLSRNSVMATEYSLWRDVAAKSPGSARAHLNLGIALANGGRYENAVREFKLALTVEPRFQARYDVLIYNDLALSYYRMGMVDEAVTVFKKVLARQPKHREANINLAVIYTDEGRYREAEDLLRKVIGIDPVNAPAHYRLAVAYSRMGQGLDAQREMELAYKYAPKDFYVNHDLAIILDGNGDVQGALKHARIALSLAEGLEREHAERLLDWLQRPAPGAGEQGAMER